MLYDRKEHVNFKHQINYMHITVIPAHGPRLSCKFLGHADTYCGGEVVQYLHLRYKGERVEEENIQYYTQERLVLRKLYIISWK